MRPLKDSLPLLSMLFSMALLVVLQVLWLAGAWREARENFRKETNNLFRHTIFAMHDSLIMRNIEPVRGNQIFRMKGVFMNDSIKALFAGDTIMHHLKVRERSSVVEVFISDVDMDSVHNILRPLSHRIRKDKRNKRFILRMGPDSLNTDSIAVHYSRALSAVGILVPFTVRHIKKEGPGRLPPVRSPRSVLATDVVPFSPLNYYTVYFWSANKFFLKAITPQILFSLFVTLLTAGSFYLMHKSIRSQRRLGKMRNDFISNVSHELKTPVSTVSVALEAMEKFKALDDPQKTTEYLRMGRNELNRLVLMTDKILQTVSFENHEPEVKVQSMDLDSEVRQVLESLKLVLQKRGIVLEYEARGSDFRMQGSPSHLVTAVYNLLDNAIKYSPQSSAIAVRVHDEGSAMFLTIKDGGIGIPPAYHKKIFEKFFRVPSGDVHNTKGYGLGLSYVARVIEAHNGRIEVESEKGKGTVFKIWMPKNAKH